MDFKNKPRPYHTLNEHYRKRFGKKVIKIPLNAGFSCPNRDGTISKTGCIYCSESGSGDFAGNPERSLKTQFDTISRRMAKKWPNGYYLPYFQANTNTYGPADHCRKLYESALSLHPDVIGLAIATRPDCLPADIINVLSDINKQTYVSVELGLQTIHEETAGKINRGHTREDFEEAVKALRKQNIEVVAHIINGLPGETPEMMKETLRFINTQDIQGIKIHMLYIQKNTPLARLHENKPVDLLSLEAYTDIVRWQIEHMRPDIVIHRLTGDAPADELIAPEWIRKKFVVMNTIDKTMRAKKTYQGVSYQP